MSISNKIIKLKLDSTSQIPLYMQLINNIKLGLANGDWLVGEAIPTERDLAKQLNISRGTVRKAIQALIAERLIVQIQGSGTFIAPKLTQSLVNLQGFKEITEQYHSLAKHRLVSITKRQATQKEMDVLQLTTGRVINEIIRTQSINNIIVSLQKAVLAIPDLISLITPSFSLYQYLDSIGRPITYATQSFLGAVADTYLADELNIAVGTPLLLVVRKGFTGNDIPVEYTYSWHINEYSDFSVELKLAE